MTTTTTHVNWIEHSQGTQTSTHCVDRSPHKAHKHFHTRVDSCNKSPHKAHKHPHTVLIAVTRALTRHTNTSTHCIDSCNKSSHKAHFHLHTRVDSCNKSSHKAHKHPHTVLIAVTRALTRHTNTSTHCVDSCNKRSHKAHKHFHTLCW